MVPGGELNPHEVALRRILSPKLGMLQQAAGYGMASHKMQRIKGLHAISISQDVALDGSSFESEHAPEHALNFGVLDGI
jgi:hypothetical protein